PVWHPASGRFGVSTTRDGPTSLRFGKGLDERAHRNRRAGPPSGGEPPCRRFRSTCCALSGSDKISTQQILDGESCEQQSHPEPRLLRGACGGLQGAWCLVMACRPATVHYARDWETPMRGQHVRGGPQAP